MQKWRGVTAVLLALFVVWAASMAATIYGKERCRNLAATTQYKQGACVAWDGAKWIKV